MNFEYKINSNEDILKVTYVKGSKTSETLPLLYRIKEGHQRYGVSGAANDKGEPVIYFQFGLSEETAKKEDGSWMSKEDIKALPIKWIAGFELTSIHQAEVLAKMFQDAADLLKEREKKDEPTV